MYHYFIWHYSVEHNYSVCWVIFTIFCVMVDVAVIRENISDDNKFFVWISDCWNNLLTSSYRVSVEEFQFLFSHVACGLKSLSSNFDEFQLKILKVFLIILLINVVLIVVLWNIFKDRIHERFIEPGNVCDQFFHSPNSST